MKDDATPTPQAGGPAARPEGMPWAQGWLLLLLNWFIPGMGFWLCGRRTRGVLQFLMVIVTFALGIWLRGGVDWPSWSFSSPEFNLINNFTFIIQLGSGFPALISLYVGSAGNHALDFLASAPTRPYYELGQYYMIVAGAVNYFATCNLHDRIVRPQPRYAVQEGWETPEATEQP